jgi:hypothetical protein
VDVEYAQPTTLKKPERPCLLNSLRMVIDDENDGCRPNLVWADEWSDVLQRKGYINMADYQVYSGL